MNWPWLRRSGESDAESQETETGQSPDAMIARADTLRDARRWSEAAGLYQSALNVSPGRPAIWVQLGHARKEAGDLTGAEEAYRQSLALAPDVADTHLQLGHVLKLQGRQPPAIASYARALRVDRFCTDALRELIALGEGWRAEQESEIGSPLLSEVLQGVAELRRALSRLESALPPVSSLTSFPIAHYRLFTTQYRLPPPPESAPSLRWGAVVFAAGTPASLFALLRSLHALEQPLAGITVVASAAMEAAARRMGQGGSSCPVQVVSPGERPPVPECDWAIILDGRTSVVPSALAWLDWAIAQTSAVALYADEDHVRVESDGMLVAETPVLKAAYDPETDGLLFNHTMVAARADVFAGVLDELTAAIDPVSALAEAVAREACVAHLPRVLSHRTAPVALAPTRTKQPSLGPEDRSRIGIVIPTRDGGALLRPCIDALRATAADSSTLDIVVLDNGSKDPATLRLLTEERVVGGITVLRDDAPFNWARLSNAGAVACSSEFLLFLNDDVEITSEGWDLALRRHLMRPEIGAVGARLLYPDGGLQHGGMVFGPGGRVEHEGVATVGVPAEICNRWTTRRRVGAVTGAFLACRRDQFEAVAQFDAASLPIWFNDVDFCLKLRRAGRYILYAPEIVAWHHESRTLAAQPEDTERRSIWNESLNDMKRRWGPAFQIDPGFNPYFARTGRPFETIREPSLTAVRDHLIRSAQPNPWLVS